MNFFFLLHSLLVYRAWIPLIVVDTVRVEIRGHDASPYKYCTYMSYMVVRLMFTFVVWYNERPRSIRINLSENLKILRVAVYPLDASSHLTPHAVTKTCNTFVAFKILVKIILEVIHTIFFPKKNYSLVDWLHKEKEIFLQVIWAICVRPKFRCL